MHMASISRHFALEFFVCTVLVLFSRTPTNAAFVEVTPEATGLSHATATSSSGTSERSELVSAIPSNGTTTGAGPRMHTGADGQTSTPVTENTIYSTISSYTFQERPGSGEFTSPIITQQGLFATPPNTTETPTTQSSPRKIPIYLSAYFTFGGGWDGSGILPACQMAIEHINQRSDVLPGYELRMTWNDTQCEAGLGTRVFFDQLYSKPQKIMILGPACSTATQAVAEPAYYWNLVTMSYAAASSALSNRQKYPFFYRTYMPDAMYNPARIRLMRMFGWRRVATIHENHDLFSLAIDDFITMSKEAGITIISSESFSEDPKNQIENLKIQDAKIIMGNMYEDKARRVFCEAYKQGMTGPDYVWMIIGWYREKWWRDEDPYVRCTVQEMTAAVEGAMYFSTESLQLSSSDEPTISGITPKEYQSQLRERLTWPENRGYTWNNLAPYGYDAAWAIALALNKSVEVLKQKRKANGTHKRLEDFTYDDREMAELFVRLLNETEFTGVSGPVGFKDGDRIGITQIEQLQGTCDEGWRMARSECFKFVLKPTYPLVKANEHCAMSHRGATLANIDDQNLLDILLNLWESDLTILPKRWHVAGSKTDGQTNTSSVSSRGPPGIAENGSCVSVDFERGGKIETTNCLSVLPFICHVHAEFAERQIALYSALDDNLVWQRDIIWPGNKPPLDRTPQVTIETIREYQGVTPPLFFSICGLATFCTFASLGFLLFNLKYRNQRHVKMSSPSLNNLIILGAVLVYMFVIIAGLDTNLIREDTFDILCHVKIWVLSVGFVVAFGAMFSKTWRVHRVAAFKTPKRRVVTDNQLFTIVFVLLLIDVIILTLWQVIDPVHIETVDLYPLEDPEVPNRIRQPFIRHCTCDTLTYWLGALYSYKGLLLIFGTFLAWETRKVSIPGLNDSKLIGISVYNVVVLCLIGVAVSVVISSNPEALYLFVSCIIIFCTSITLIVVFVPKIIAVVKFPDGDQSLPTSRARPNKIVTETPSTLSLSAENNQLKQRLKELEKQIRAKEERPPSGPPTSIRNGCGCWSCGLVCGFSTSRGESYGANQDNPVDPVDTEGPDGTSIASL